MASIKLPDGSVKELPDGTTIQQIAESIGKGLAKAAVAAKVDGKVVDLSTQVSGSHELAILTDRDPEALYVLRHSTAHVMAEAIKTLWPNALLAYGPALDTGFYYDIALEDPISTNDFGKIEAEMKKIVEENRPFQRYSLPLDAAYKKLKWQDNEYKKDNAKRAVEGGARELSWYITGQPTICEVNGGEYYDLDGYVYASVTSKEGKIGLRRFDESELYLSDITNTTARLIKKGDWEDLCQGPHVPSTGKIKAFKIMSVAQSHWHGNVDSDKFQRVYGTAFFDKKQLDEHLKMIEEAKKRDHRVLGPQLGLYTIDDAVGQGLILWKPKGAIVRQELQNFISEHLRRQGYSQVFTPHIGRLGLYRTSGHYPYYRESQFPPLVDREMIDKLADEKCSCADLSNRMESGDIDGYLLKPMNCPMHIKIFSSEQRSYRDMPVRLAEFGTVYRWEKSGELGGMTRVRGFTQDDAHLFCTEEQVPAEIQGCLELVKIVLGTLGMNQYRVRVGLRDPDSSKYVGDPAQWDKAEAACISAAESLGVTFTKEPGEAAFYGPKIDFVVKDVIGREWQLGTVQVDYQLPQRFDLSYTGADNKPHRPVMIHRAPFGSMERFIGVLTEHFAGAFPLWLAPVQVAVLSISEKFNDYATSIVEQLKSASLRVESNLSPEKIGAKIRQATLDKIPYMLILGEKEQAANTVAVRHRTAGDRGAMPVAQFIDQLKSEITQRSAS
ncbi:MAG TPA: threonine--tRNA ligase [Tepidisphaeraceae bacterium]|nr:threonine--tRNA ligase [Tepidisphaeraceae bacterium]